MVDRRLLDVHDGIYEYIVFDDLDPEKFTIEYQCDVEPLLDFNQAYKSMHDGYTPSRDLQWVASVPLHMGEKIKQEMGGDPWAKGNEDLLTRFLNDQSYAKFRTGGGRVEAKRR